MSNIKIFSIDGEIVEIPKCKDIYLALFKKDIVWSVSGVIYNDIKDIEPNLYNFKPDAIVIIKIKWNEDLVKKLDNLGK